MAGLYNSPTWVHRVTDIPKTEHYGIFYNETVTEPGYDPGDPHERRNIVEYRVFKQRSDWEDEIRDLTLKGEDFLAVVVNPAKIDVKVTPMIEVSHPRGSSDSI